MLHRDFNDQNLIVTTTGLRIIDFDDCGLGPIEYDIANSLYMVLFDSYANSRPALYETFKPSFFDGYSLGADRRVNAGIVHELIATRIRAHGSAEVGLHRVPTPDRSKR